MIEDEGTGMNPGDLAHILTDFTARMRPGIMRPEAQVLACPSLNGSWMPTEAPYKSYPERI